MSTIFIKGKYSWRNFFFSELSNKIGVHCFPSRAMIHIVHYNNNRLQNRIIELYKINWNSMKKSFDIEIGMKRQLLLKDPVFIH